MKKPHTHKWIAILLASTWPLSAAFAQEALPPEQQQGPITFIMGGIGGEESAAIKAVQKNYNLLITSADSSGHYYADTHVTLRDMQQNILLDTVGGPLFYARVPNGKYFVTGTSQGGQHKQQRITISGGKPVRIHFSWHEADNITPQTKE